MQSCDDNNLATQFCADCEENFCDDCVKAHKRLKITRDHKMTPIENNIQSSRSISTAAGIPTQDLKCKRFGGKLSFFCEQTEMLACKECQLADKDKGYTYRPTHEVAPDVKASLSQAASDVRLKRNVLGKGHQKYGLIINLFSPTSLSHFFLLQMKIDPCLEPN